MTTPRVAQKAKPEWTRSPIQTRARARKENRDPSINSAEAHNGLARLRDHNGDRTVAGLASRDMNISNNAAGLPPAPRKTIARRRRVTEPTGDPSKLPRRVPYVLAPPRPDPPLSSRVPPPPTNQSTHSVAVPEPSGSVEDDDEKSTVGDSATTVAQSHKPPPGKVKEEPAAEYSARCIDFMKLPRPATRKQRRQTLFFDRPREDMPEAQLNVATLPLAPSSAPVGILITSNNSSYVPTGNVHFTPPTVHCASSGSAISLGPAAGLASDEVISPGFESVLLFGILRFIFASLVRVVVILFYGVTLGLMTLTILVLLIRTV